MRRSAFALSGLALLCAACASAPRVVDITLRNAGAEDTRLYLRETRSNLIDSTGIALQPTMHYVAGFDLSPGETLVHAAVCLPVQVWVVGRDTVMVWDDTSVAQGPLAVNIDLATVARGGSATYQREEAAIAAEESKRFMATTPADRARC